MQVAEKVSSKSCIGSYRWGYQGQFSEKDSLTNWNAFQLRMYDARFGRWLSPDPYGQFDSPYVGMGNNPVSGVDPDGGIYISPKLAEALAIMAETGVFPLPEIVITGSRIVEATAWESLKEFGKDIGRGFVTTFRRSTIIVNGINQSYAPVIPDYGGDNETANNLRTQGQVFGYGTQVIMNLPSSGVSSSTPNLSHVTVQGPRLTPPAVPAIKTTHVVLTSSSNTNADVDEGHHLLPKQFEPYFKRAGLDVEKYKIPLPRSRHRLKPNGVHTTNGGNWNNRWKEFFATNPNASKETILQFLAKLRSEFGI